MRLLIAIVLLLASPAFGVTGSGVTFSGVATSASEGGGGGLFGACTDGVDCFCDTLASTHTYCEDWEDARWTGTAASSAEWSDYPGGDTAFRGGASLWQSLYGSTGGPANCDWGNGEPPSPTYGNTCGYSACGAVAQWRPDDYYQGNAYTCIDFFKEGDANESIDAEVSGLTLTGGHSASGEIFSGNQMFAYRQPTSSPAGMQTNLGFCGSTCGITFAQAHSTNILSANPLAGTDWLSYGYPWKGQQFNTQYQFPTGNTGPTNGETGAPFAGGWEMTAGSSTCLSVNASATQTIGTLDGPNSCSGAWRWRAAGNGEGPTAANEFDRSDDWPLGNWACIRFYIESFGTSSTSMWIEFQGPNDSSPRRIFEVSNLDTNTLFGGDTSLGDWDFDHYLNQNGDPGLADTTAPVYIYYDNIVVNNGGQPVSCADIGF